MVTQLVITTFPVKFPLSWVSLLLGSNLSTLGSNSTADSALSPAGCDGPGGRGGREEQRRHRRWEVRATSKHAWLTCCTELSVEYKNGDSKSSDLPGQPFWGEDIR